MRRETTKVGFRYPIQGELKKRHSEEHIIRILRRSKGCGAAVKVPTGGAGAPWQMLRPAARGQVPPEGGRSDDHSAPEGDVRQRRLCGGQRSSPTRFLGSNNKMQCRLQRAQLQGRSRRAASSAGARQRQAQGFMTSTAKLTSFHGGRAYFVCDLLRLSSALSPLFLYLPGELRGRIRQAPLAQR